MSDITQLARIDTWVNQAAPSATHQQAAWYVLSNTASAAKLGLIYFAIPFPLGATVSNAKLQVYAKSVPANTTLRANRITAPWTEDKVTYTTRPAISATNYDLAITTAAVDGTLLEIDVTTMMQNVAAGQDFYGIQLSVTGTGNNWLFYAADNVNADYAPTLVCTYSTTPEAPDDLRPGGGNNASPAQPHYAWQPDTDPDSSTQAKSRVQVWNDLRTSILYDSGLVANVSSSWDTAGTSHPNLTDGQHVWWRVMYQDALGLNSPWSILSGFYRNSQGTLAWVNPSGATIDSPVYPFSWSLTGRTQEAYEMLLYKLPAAGSTDVPQLIWHFPKTTSTATSQQVDPGLIVSGQSYQMVLRVWDTLARQTIPGAPAWTTITKNFTYVRPTAATPGTTGLTATVDPNVTEAGVLLNWNGPATTPDFFSVRQDGVEVVSRVNPADVLVSGTNFQMYYWGADADISHTYEVESVAAVGGYYKHSSANSTASATTTRTSKWLVDHQPGKDLKVRILDRDTPSLTIGESATTYYPVASRKPVRITDSIRGYEGTVTGHVASKADADNILKMKGRVNQRFRLITKTLNIPVRLGEVSVAPDSSFSPQDYWSVSIEVMQVDEFFKLPGIHIPGDGSSNENYGLDV